MEVNQMEVQMEVNQMEVQMEVNQMEVQMEVNQVIGWNDSDYVKEDYEMDLTNYGYD